MTCLKVLLKRNLIFFSHCSINGYFTIEELNSRIQNFIGPKPSLIDSKPHAHDYNIRQSASQMISLLKEFPILIGDKIPEALLLPFVAYKNCINCIVPYPFL